MSFFIPRRTTACFALAVLPLFPAVATSQALPNGDGMVEFVGLSVRTPASIREAFGGKVDGGAVHYCAATLIDDLEMADAAVVYYRQENGEDYILVTVIEPEQRDRVVYRPAPSGQSRSIASFAELSTRLQKRDMGMQLAMLNSGRLVHADIAAALRELQPPAEASATIRQIWNELRAHRDERTFHRALWALEHDPDPADRAAAAAILVNFSDRDLSWWALADGLRDGDQAVRGVCSQVLYSLTRHAPRPVDWTPAGDSLRHVLAGTNLFALSNVMRMLVATNVAPELAGPLLTDNSDLVFGYLQASHEPVREQARALLRQLHGTDLGVSVGPWRQWVSTLVAE